MPVSLFRFGLTDIGSMKSLLVLPFAIMLAACAVQAPDPERLRTDEIALVHSTVADPVRAAQLLALIDERDRLVAETRAMLAQYRREMQAVNADYDASRDVVIEMIDYYNRERARKQLAFIELITKMKRTTSADEWSAIADFQLENYNPRKLIYRPLEAG